MERHEMAIRMSKWAKQHPWEWGVICGFLDASLDENLMIAEILQDEGFYELNLMLTIRVTMMLLETEE